MTPQIAAGGNHTCALTTAGGVKCWGANDYGQLGDNSTTQRLTPVDVSGLTSGVAAIATAYQHTCALTKTGGVKCWGRNFEGELGDNSTTQRLTPVDVSGLASGVTAIAAGQFHTCALTSAGGVKCWGWNVVGQLGDNSTTGRLAPVDVSGLASGVASIAPGYHQTCALTKTGGVKCWGANYWGQLGDNSTTDHLTPVDVSGFASGVTAIATGYYHTCALTTTSGVKCWGMNLNGQLGDNSAPGTLRLTPVEVSGLASGAMAIAAGQAHTCALTTAGGVKCWGYNGGGQLGDNSVIDRLTPVDVSGLASGVTAIAARFVHTCALTTASEVKCWGSNSNGQLGDGTTTNRLSPVQVLGPDGLGFLNLRVGLPAPSLKVVFIPGLEASRLYVCDGADESPVWPTLFTRTFSNLALDPATAPGPGQSPTITSQKEVYTRDLVLETPIGSNIYKGFKEYMDQNFPAGNWEAFPYDWRLGYDQILDQGVTIRDLPSPCSGFGRVRNLISEVENFEGKISIVAHSNGGLLAKRLIQRLVERGTAAKVDKLVLVASPQFGTPRAQEILFHGANFPSSHWTFDSSVVQAIALNMPVVYNMLPTREFFNYPLSPCNAGGCKTVSSFIGPLATDMSLSALAADVDSYVELRGLASGESPYQCPSSVVECTDAPQTVNAILLAGADAEHQDLDGFSPPDTLKVFQIVGMDLPTVSKIEYKKESLDGVGDVFSFASTESPTAGDGTVMLNSALGKNTSSKTFVLRMRDCNDAVNKAAFNPIIGKFIGPFITRDHASILELPMVQDLVRKVLLDLVVDGTSFHPCIDPPPLGQSEPPIVAHGIDSLRVSLASPAEVHAIDSENRHTGPIASPVADSDAQFMEQKIPNSTFRFPHQLWLDTGKGPYNIVVLGKGTGTFSLIVERYIDEDQQSKIVYPNVPVTPQTVAKLDLTIPEDNPKLQVDIDGNGTVDLVVEPLPTQPPVANAGPSRTVRLGSFVQLDGSRSFDPDNGPLPLSYHWTQIGGPVSVPLPAFTPIVIGAYTFSLIVNDGKSSSKSATVAINVPMLGDVDLNGIVDQNDLKLILAARNQVTNGPNDLRDLNGDGKIDDLDVVQLRTLCGAACNRAPIANAGADRTVAATSSSGASVMLDGSSSSDSDGDALTFAWTGPFGTTTGSKPTVTLPLGTDVVTLNVSDGKGGTATATVTIRVVDTTPPVVKYTGNAGTYAVDQTVSITCAATDSGSGIVSTTCKNISGPAYSFALGTNTFSASATDAAGNVGNGSTSFTIKDSTASLVNLVNQFVTGREAKADLIEILKRIAVAIASGKPDVKARQISEFVSEVREQPAKVISSANAAILIRLAKAL